MDFDCLHDQQLLILTRVQITNYRDDHAAPRSPVVANARFGTSL